MKQISLLFMLTKLSCQCSKAITMCHLTGTICPQVKIESTQTYRMQTNYIYINNNYDSDLDCCILQRILVYRK
jgi:hypothetical protein